MSCHSISNFCVYTLTQIIALICLLNGVQCGQRTICTYDTVTQEAKFVEMTDNSTYKKWMRPLSDEPIVVTVSIEMYGIAPIQEKHSEFDIQMLIDLDWIDNRLQINSSDCEDIEDLMIEGSEWHFDRVWSPKLRVPNNKNPAALDKDANIVLLRVSSNGNIRVRKRFNLDLLCPMDFTHYPFDNQSCKLSIISSLTVEKLKLIWSEEEEEQPFIGKDSFHMSAFKLDSYELNSANTSTRGERFSTITIRIHITREWVHYIFDTYLPSILIVIISWISFWMDITATPARITLGVTTLLTFVTVSKDARNLPIFVYMNLMEIWFVFCTGFIFFSLIEFSVITYISRAEKRKIREMKTLRRNASLLFMSSTDTQLNFNNRSPPRSPKTTNNGKQTPDLFSMYSKSNQLQPRANKIQFTISPPDSTSVESLPEPISNILKMSPVEIAESIDRKCRFIFPLLFILFNLIYWIYVIIT